MKVLRSITLFIALLSFAGRSLAFEAMDRHFIYFPDRTLHATPAVAGLPFEEVFFPAADGVRLHGWYLPGDPAMPLVLFAHGNAGNISHRIDNLVGFHRLGLPVFIFDYRGYGLSEGRTTEEGTYEDIRGALAWLKKHGRQPRRIVYFGRSLGAAVALQLAVEEPPAGLVLESAFTSVADMGRHHQPLTYVLIGWWTLSAKYDNLAKISRLRCPLLLFQGEQDSIVPPEMARQLLDKAPSPKTFYLISGADHNDTYMIGGEPYWQQWRDFIEKLPERSGPE